MYLKEWIDMARNEKKDSNDYKEQLNDPRWIDKRNKILARDKITCQFCLCTHRRMHVHHLKYVPGKKAWEYPDKSLITICESCHKEETSFKSRSYDIFKMLQDKMRDKGFSSILFVNLLWALKDCIAPIEGVKGEPDSFINFFTEVCSRFGTRTDIIAARKMGYNISLEQRRFTHKVDEDEEKF